MSRNRPVRLFYALTVAVALILIGRNLYHRHVNNALIDAVRTRNVSAVRRLLAQGADPNYRFVDRTRSELPVPPQPILNLVNMYADPSDTDGTSYPPPVGQIVLLLLRHGAHWQGAQMLEWACGTGDVPIVAELLQRGDDPNAPTNAGALSRAIFYSTSFRPDTSTRSPIPVAQRAATRAEVARRQEVSRQLVNLLQAHGAHLSLTQAQDMGDRATLRTLLASGGPGIVHEGYVAMSTAAWKGDLETLRQLLKLGIDPNRPPHSGTLHLETSGLPMGMPLFDAVAGDHIEAARLLLAHGADPNLTSAWHQGFWALNSAAWTGHLDMVKLLVAHGAKVGPSSSDATTPNSPLEMAVRSKHPVVADYLLQQGASTSTRRNAAPVLAVALRYLPELVPDLLKRGAPVNPPPALAVDPRNAVSTAPYSPLMAAIFYAPQYEATLVRAGAKIGPDRQVVCVAAARQKRMDLLPKLLAYGADINGVDGGNTALSICVENGPEAVKALLEHGAKPNVLSSEFRTPLQAAAMLGNSEVVRLLLAHGADVNASVKHGHTALYWARKKNHADIVTLLQQAGAKE
jgi:ankyrin repeat protein